MRKDLIIRIALLGAGLAGLVCLGLMLVNSASRPFLSSVSIDVNQSTEALASASKPLSILPQDSSMSVMGPSPSRLSPVLATTKTTNFEERVKVLRSIKGELTQEEVQALYGYLLTANRPDANFRIYENWLRHEMMEKLVGQRSVPPRLESTLIAIYKSPDQDVVMRDYAVQHLGPLYHRLDGRTQAELRPLLWNATGEIGTSIGGTALLALYELTQTSSEFSRTDLRETALKIAWDEGSGELTRITALQVCGRLRVGEVEPLALRLAHEEGSAPLRISAIAVLGEIGGPESKALLEGIGRGAGERLAEAAARALERLNKRPGN